MPKKQADHRLSQRRKLDLEVERSGAAEGTRTPDPIITNDVLYHLSYSGHGAVFSTAP